jgi:hypothetical protein
MAWNGVLDACLSLWLVLVVLGLCLPRTPRATSSPRQRGSAYNRALPWWFAWAYGRSRKGRG